MSMLPIQHIQTILEGLPPDLQDIVLEIRSIIAQAAPGVTETYRRNYFSYYYAERGGPVSAGVCGVGWSPGCIRLAFPHGAFIPDPQSLLEGDRLAMRWLHLYAFNDVPWEAVRALITAHARFDPRAPR